MKKVKILLFVLMLSISTSAYELTVGTVMGYEADEYKGVDADFMGMWGYKGPLPYVSFDSEYFFAGITGIAVHLVRTPIYAIDAGFTLSPNQFDPEDSSDPAVKQVDSRDMTLFFGVVGEFNTPYGSLKGSMMMDILSESDTSQLSLTYSYTYPLTMRFILIPSITGTWENASHFDYYYGVSPAESAQSGLDEYRVGNAGYTTKFEITAIYMLSENISLMGMCDYTYLSSQATDSPLVDGSTVYSIMGGIMYKLGKPSTEGQNNTPTEIRESFRDEQPQTSMDMLRNSRNTRNE